MCDPHLLPLYVCDLSSPVPLKKRLLLAFYLHSCSGTLTRDDPNVWEEEVDQRQEMAVYLLVSVLSLLGCAFRSFCVNVNQLFSYQLPLQSRG